MSFKGAIFDLDGVIVDTVPLHFKAWQKMFSEYGKEFTFEDYKKKVDGIPRINGAKAILGKLPQEELERAASKKQEYFLEFLEKEGVKVYQSTLNLIKELKEKGIKIAVVSSSKNCRYILKKANIEDLFDVIITGLDIKKGKPDPEIFILACKNLGLKPSECIVFEDALLGVEAAKNAKMWCVGIDRYNNPERLKKADLIVSDLKEVNFEILNDHFSKSKDEAN